MNHEILLTADQVVVYNNRILEKPKDKKEAQSFIEGYGTLPCSTVGSIVLTDLRTKKRVQGVDTCNIYFDPIPDNIIQQLLDEGEKSEKREVSLIWTETHFLFFFLLYYSQFSILCIFNSLVKLYLCTFICNHLSLVDRIVAYTFP